MNPLNHQLFEWIGGGFAPNMAALWLATQLVTDLSWIGAGAIAVAVWRHPANRYYILATCAMAVLAGMLAREFADMLEHPRPFMIGVSPEWVEHASRGSLPSTHASVMFTAALCFLFRPRLRVIGWVLAGLALLTCWARVYVGIHFPLDIAAGLVLAGGLAAGPGLAGRWLQRLHPAGRNFSA